MTAVASPRSLWSWECHPRLLLDIVERRDILLPVIGIILSGEIIEEYPDRQRVLILARLSESNLPVHVVCDHADPDEIVAITVYVPSRDEWIADRTRKNKQQK